MARVDVSSVNFFQKDHRRCENLWAGLQEALNEENAESVLELFEQYDAALRRHIAMEEEVLFPALEELMGTTEGPTAFLRGEHEQIRELLTEFAGHVQKRELEPLTALGEKMTAFTQQHHTKEERRLFPMAGYELDWAPIEPQLRTYFTA
jgi:hemerythrin-like domain-containing protein